MASDAEGRCAKCCGSGSYPDGRGGYVCDECQGFGTFKHKAPPSDAEVEKLHAAIGGQPDVRGLDVAMDEALVLDVLNV